MVAGLGSVIWVCPVLSNSLLIGTQVGPVGLCKLHHCYIKLFRPLYHDAAICVQHTTEVLEHCSPRWKNGLAAHVPGGAPGAGAALRVSELTMTRAYM